MTKSFNNRYAMTFLLHKVKKQSVSGGIWGGNK